MKKILLATAVFLSLSGQVFAQNMIDERPTPNAPTPKLSPEIIQIIKDNRHVALCMAMWGMLGKLDTATGIALIDNPATLDLGKKFLNDSQLDVAKIAAALELATNVFPERIKKAGQNDVDAETVLGTTIETFSNMLTQFTQAIGVDMRADYRALTKIRVESTACDTFLGSLGNFEVKTPESVDLNKIRSAD